MRAVASSSMASATIKTSSATGVQPMVSVSSLRRGTAGGPIGRARPAASMGVSMGESISARILSMALAPRTPENMPSSSRVSTRRSHAARTARPSSVRPARMTARISSAVDWAW